MYLDQSICPLEFHHPLPACNRAGLIHGGIHGGGDWPMIFRAQVAGRSMMYLHYVPTLYLVPYCRQCFAARPFDSTMGNSESAHAGHADPAGGVSPHARRSNTVTPLDDRP